MSLKIDTLMHSCEQISEEFADLYKDLRIKFVVHHAGQLSDALVVVAQEVEDHPAAANAYQIMKKRYMKEESGYMGTAVAEEHFFFGLASKHSLLSLCNLNINEFKNIRDARQHAYHLAWHSIDSYNYYNSHDSDYSGRNTIITRKRNALEIASANLQADIFSCVILYLNGEIDAIKYVGKRRGAESLTAKSKHTPEFFPYVIAMDAADAALKKFEKKSHMNKRQIITAAIKISREIGQVFDASSISKWIGFSKPAQEMAWRGHSRAEILCAAINTSQDTFVRSTAFLVSEITDTNPAPLADISDVYSPFADSDYNQELHNKTINKIYEDIITQGLARKDVSVLSELANKQNSGLTEGRVTGWCANALQAAVTAYEKAILSGSNEPDLAALREFEQQKLRTNWGSLEELGHKVIKENRKGGMVTMKSLAEICDEIKDMGEIEESINKTMRDTGYSEELEQVNELNVVNALSGPALNAPQMKATVTHSAAPAAPTMPGMGMGGGAKQPPAQPQQATQQATQQAKQKATKRAAVKNKGAKAVISSVSSEDKSDTQSGANA